MKKRMIKLLCAGFLSIGFISAVNAALLPRLGGLAVYDTDTDVTWLANANAGAGSSFDDTGTGGMTWAHATAWAASLTVGGFNDWRLPSVPFKSNGGFCIGALCTDSEMGHLYFGELGGAVNVPALTSGDPDLALFTNIQSADYWTSTSGASPFALQFSMRTGAQLQTYRLSRKKHAWAVRSGDVGAPPQSSCWIDKMDHAAVGGLSGYVWVVDGDGSRLRSGNVHARWTYPNGTTADQVRRIAGTRARAQFGVGLPQPLPGGTYTLTVTDVISDSCVFDPAMSTVLEHSVTLPGAPNPNQSPVAAASADISSGEAPLVVNFDSTASSDPDGSIVAYEWNFKDGSAISTEPNPVHTFNTPGLYDVALTVADDEGSQNTATLQIMVTKATTGCDTNCLQISSIKMSNRRSSVRAKVKVVDEAGETVSGAVVSATWTFPDGHSITQSRRSNRKGKVKFTARKSGVGTYVFDITDVTVGGFTFDPDNSVMSDMITIH